MRPVSRTVWRAYEALSEQYPKLYSGSHGGFVDYLTQLYRIAESVAAQEHAHAEQSKLSDTLTDAQIEALFDRVAEMTAKVGLDRAGSTIPDQVEYLTGSSATSPTVVLVAGKAYRLGVRDAAYRFVEMTRKADI
jgi:hypothetical protein